LVEAFSSLDELRDHYKHHGAKEKRYVPYVAASLTVAKTINTPFLCHHKWLLALNRFVDLAKYSDYILTNDSILIVRSLLPFVQATFRPEIDMSSLLASKEIQPHYPDFLRRYNKKGIAKIRHFYADSIDSAQRKIHRFQRAVRAENKRKMKGEEPSQKSTLSNPITYDYMVRNFEIGSCAIFKEVAVYRQAEELPLNIHFIFPYVKKWIEEENYEVVKLKFLRHKRFDYPGDFSDAQRPEKQGGLPRDFKSAEYAALNPDIDHLGPVALRRHFIKNGIKEGRPYSPSQIHQLIGFLRPLVRFDATGRIFTSNAPLPPRKLRDLIVAR
jgi:hypothetical protein